LLLLLLLLIPSRDSLTIHAMKPHFIRRAFSSVLAPAALLAALLSTTAADLSTTLAGVARYESGGDVCPLREIEQRVAESGRDVQLRTDLEAGLAGILTGEATYEGRRFACQQLAVIGHEASVSALAGLLAKEETAGIAAAALAQNSADKAGAALRAALNSATGRARAPIAFALGTRRDAAAVEPLGRLTTDADLAVAEAAVVALGKIGTPPAQATLANLRRQCPEPLTRAVAEASLTVAEQLVARNDAAGAAAIYNELLAAGRPDDLRRGALGGLLRTDPDGGEKRMLEVLGGNDAALKPAAIAAASRAQEPGRLESLRGRAAQARAGGAVSPGAGARGTGRCRRARGLVAAACGAPRTGASRRDRGPGLGGRRLHRAGARPGGARGKNRQRTQGARVGPRQPQRRRRCGSGPGRAVAQPDGRPEGAFPRRPGPPRQSRFHPRLPRRSRECRSRHGQTRLPGPKPDRHGGATARGARRPGTLERQGCTR